MLNSFFMSCPSVFVSLLPQKLCFAPSCMQDETVPALMLTLIMLTLTDLLLKRAEGYGQSAHF